MFFLVLWTWIHGSLGDQLDLSSDIDIEIDVSSGIIVSFAESNKI